MGVRVGYFFLHCMCRRNRVGCRRQLRNIAQVPAGLATVYSFTPYFHLERAPLRRAGRVHTVRTPRVGVPDLLARCVSFSAEDEHFVSPCALVSRLLRSCVPLRLSWHESPGLPILVLCGLGLGSGFPLLVV